MEGIVKWFNNQKGWGFIVPEDGQEDIFVHYSEIKGDGFKTLKAGQRVTYQLEHGNKGLYARDVNAQGEVLLQEMVVN
ncbi:MAG: cold shock domain-containing protein [Myxococcota bacterium]